MREGDIIAKQFWGDIIANLLHSPKLLLDSTLCLVLLTAPSSRGVNAKLLDTQVKVNSARGPNYTTLCEGSEPRRVNESFDRRRSSGHA
jgi:hypothetical protein